MPAKENFSSVGKMIKSTCLLTQRIQANDQSGSLDSDAPCFRQPSFRLSISTLSVLPPLKGMLKLRSPRHRFLHPHDPGNSRTFRIGMAF